MSVISLMLILRNISAFDFEQNFWEFFEEILKNVLIHDGNMNSSVWFFLVLSWFGVGQEVRVNQSETS